MATSCQRLRWCWIFKTSIKLRGGGRRDSRASQAATTSTGSSPNTAGTVAFPPKSPTGFRLPLQIAAQGIHRGERYFITCLRSLWHWVNFKIVGIFWVFHTIHLCFAAGWLATRRTSRRQMCTTGLWEERATSTGDSSFPLTISLLSKCVTSQKRWVSLDRHIYLLVVTRGWNALHDLRPAQVQRKWSYASFSLTIVLFETQSCGQVGKLA